MTDVRHIGGPERIYDKNAADPDWKPRPVGFTADISTEPVDKIEVHEDEQGVHVERKEETDGQDVSTQGRD